ncbi:MAG TPA: hypothetical protein VH518_08980 [Tepidisphaeraceae bacterium]|jgi:hypothetical protein
MSASAAAPAGGSAPGPRAGGTVFNKTAAGAAAKQREKAHGSVEIPWGMIAGGVVALLLLAGVIAFIMGPKKVWNEWEQIGAKADDEVSEVVSRGLQGYMAAEGFYDPSKAHMTPECKEVMFYRPTWAMSMPDSVDFQGVTTEGKFIGKYSPKTGDVHAVLDIESLATGKAPARKVPTITVDGQVKNGQASFQVNGKKMDQFGNSK